MKANLSLTNVYGGSCSGKKSVKGTITARRSVLLEEVLEKGDVLEKSSSERAFYKCFRKRQEQESIPCTYQIWVYTVRGTVSLIMLFPYPLLLGI